MAKQPFPDPRKGPIAGKPKCRYSENGVRCTASPTHEVLWPNSIYPDEPHKDPYCAEHADVMLAFYNRYSNVAVKRPYVAEPLTCEHEPTGLLGWPKRVFGLRRCGRSATCEVFDRFGNSMAVCCDPHGDELVAFFAKLRNDPTMWRDAASDGEDPYSANGDDVEQSAGRA